MPEEDIIADELNMLVKGELKGNVGFSVAFVQALTPLDGGDPNPRIQPCFCMGGNYACGECALYDLSGGPDLLEPLGTLGSEGMSAEALTMCVDLLSSLL